MEENFSMEWKWNERKLPVWNMEKSSSIPYHALIAVLGLLITSVDCTSKSLLTYRVEHGLFRPYTLY